MNRPILRIDITIHTEMERYDKNITVYNIIICYVNDPLSDDIPTVSVLPIGD